MGVSLVPGRMGILGGTFDPIHVGHLALAEEAREALGLERVLFVPAGHPWQKAGSPVTPVVDRVAMTGLAIASNPAFELSTAEAFRPGPTYTADTLEALASDQRRLGREPDLWFILSTETFLALSTWHEPERLLATCRLAVAPRPGYRPADPGWLERTFPGLGDRAAFLDGPVLDVSARDLRERVREGRSIRYLVPDAVVAYIGDHGLYTDTEGRSMPS
ncbi:MAG TPA: nicotinate-nucleotide adenylyltransferase [Candidatus Dormibacteraeota bacterium]|nr:nicotinate-nucleotide adenylyltransferase [Candidatus Dormibacteraeota bacterium]